MNAELSTTNLLVPMGSIVPVPANQIASTMQTDYCGNVIYENGVLSKILTEEGYITLIGTTPVYHYYLKDHQGNNRVVVDQSGVVEQVNHYYPFGMTYGDGIATSNQPYKYNGKELDRMHGLDWYDYGARNYDAALGRWHSVDPHAENYNSWSPYHYVANNPIIMIDLDGRDWYQSTDKDGAVMWQEGSADVEGYKNLGTNYTQNIGNGISITYTQNEATSMTTNIMTSDQWVSQYSKSDWDGTPASKACNKASDAMLAKDGNSSNGMTIVVNNAGDGRAGTANGNATNAISDMSKALDFDKPTKVNVDYRSGSGSGDMMGDHFVVVQGKTEQLGNGKVTSNTFHYFDPGTSHQSKGTSSSNILRVQNNRLVGTHINNGLPIVVTSIRPNR